MNPLGQMPGSSSAAGALNATDAKKIARMMLVQIIGLGLTLGIPYLTGMHYVINGTDITPEVLVVVNGAAEIARRLLTGTKPQ